MKNNKSKRLKISVDLLAHRSEPVAQAILSYLIDRDVDLLSAIAALEAAKRTIIMLGSRAHGEPFEVEVDQLLESFDNCEQTMIALAHDPNAFMQKGGEC